MPEYRIIIGFSIQLKARAYKVTFMHMSVYFQIIPDKQQSAFERNILVYDGN